MSGKRRCEGCGAALSDEAVMKIQIDDGSWETIPLPLCPKCFKESLMKSAKKEKQDKR